ncbi:MAG: DUF192 domain-containing protein [Candidatus Schekmanbacteria bacterium]|nr:MAG: DUF192 domain-containing protein [Candidatus Schekmanbacteria bacterium]
MKKIIIALIVLAGVALYSIPNTEPVALFENKKFYLEVAKTPIERQRGLMYRENLCNSCGMLFVFEKEGELGFWMKNTKIPLDIVFIGSDYKIKKIVHAKPCKSETCEIYKGIGKYVLEVNLGEFDEGDIGKTIILKPKYSKV